MISIHKIITYLFKKPYISVFLLLLRFMFQKLILVGTQLLNGRIPKKINLQAEKD
jgi:hypothetical protein